jgi:hypothetical protein
MTIHEYIIHSTETRPFLHNLLFPITHTFYLTPDHTIDPPSSRLLVIHRAIAFILKMSGAGEYISTRNRLTELSPVSPYPQPWGFRHKFVHYTSVPLTATANRWILFNSAIDLYSCKGIVKFGKALI